MSTGIDKEVIDGFVAEAKGYLPRILEGIASFRKGPGQEELLKEAHRCVHIIKGASGMVGLFGLGHVAFRLEEVLDEVMAGQLGIDARLASLLGQTVVQIESYLDGVSTGNLQEQVILAEVARTFRRIRGLPESGDETAVLAELRHAAPVVQHPGNASEAPASVEPADTMEMELQQFQQETSENLTEPFFDTSSPELLESFLVEAQDHLGNVARLLPQIDFEPEPRDLIQQIRRSIHTLKGAAALLHFRQVAQLSHRMEDLLDGLFEGSSSLTSEARDLLFASSDMLEDMVRSGLEDPSASEPRLAGLYARYASVLRSSPAVPAEEPESIPFPSDLQESAALPEPPAASLAQISLVQKAPAAGSGQVIRVSLDRLDDLVKLVSELVISRSSFEQHHKQLDIRVDELHHSIERLKRLSTKLETQYEASALDGGSLTRARTSAAGANGVFQTDPAARHGFDELELDRYTEFHLLSRELTETTADTTVVDNELRDIVGDFDAYIGRQERLTGEIQDKLMKLRMVPVATAATRLHRAVRVTAQHQQKQVELLIEGEQVELDKKMLEELADPLLHLVRNAVDHGIEPPALRQVLGKPQRGQIRLRAFYAGTQVVLQISDDGAGLDPEILRAAALRGGYASEEEAARLSNDDLYSLVFVPGFSTAREVSEISGRGVGMDIVKTTVHKLKGSISIHSAPGQGVTFTIRLPLTLALARVLLVKANSEVFALPLGTIRQILRVEKDEIQFVGREPVLRIEGKVYPMLRLGDVLHLKRAPQETAAHQPVMLLDVGDQQFALVVDQLVEGREVVVKSLGSHLRRVHGISGATLMGDGSVVLILNPSDFVHEAAGQQRLWKAPAHAPAAAAHESWNIFVVDDSFSVRRVLSNLVKHAGWNPVEAKDGLEALELIQRAAPLPDLVLLDIEMPRMDGYELTSVLRAQAVYKSLPIVMLTSRSGAKHRQKALQLGVTDYLVKPFQNEVLLDVIRKRIRDSRGTPSS